MFENMPGFERLSPEAKTLVEAKFKEGFQKLSPEAQQLVQQKIGAQQQQRMSPQQALEMQKRIPASPIPAPGTVPPGAYAGAMGQETNPFKAMDQAGEAVGVGLAEAGVDPRLAAGVGTGFQMMPDIATLGIPGTKAPAAAKAAAPVAAKAGQAMVKPMQTFVKRLFGKGEKLATLESNKVLSELRLAKEAAEKGSSTRHAYQQAHDFVKQEIKNATTQFKGLKAELGNAKDSLKQQINFMENKLGLKLNPQQAEAVEKVISNPKLARAKAQQIINLSEKPIETLQKLDSQTLQTLKKTTEALIRHGGLDDTTKVLLKKSNTKLGQAIPETAQLRADLGSVYKQLDTLPKVYKSRSAELQKRLVSYESKLKQIKQADKQKIDYLKKQITKATEESAELILEAHKNDLVRKRALYTVLSMAGVRQAHKFSGIMGGQ